MRGAIPPISGRSRDRNGQTGPGCGHPGDELHSYVDLLETLYLIQQIPAWSNNLTRRVTGRPKVSLLDTGLAARLNNVTPSAMQPGVVSEAAGGLFEAFVAGELRRQLVWSDTDASLAHFRDTDGLEVDLVPEDSGRRVAGVELKAARTVTKREFRGLEFLRDKLGTASRSASCSTPGRTRFRPERCWALRSGQARAHAPCW